MRYQEFKEMSHREAEKILKKNNFHKERAHGSHEVYKNDDTGETFALPHKHHTKDLSKGVEHDLKKVVAEGEDDAGWYRGISKQEADNIRKGGLPKPSAVPIPMDNEVMDYLGIDDEEAWELQKEVEGTAVINVTNDEQNAEGYGDEVLWFERHLVDLDFKPYGLINIDTLQRNPDSWGLVTPWDEQVNEDEEKPLPPEVERWIEGRSPEDVSVDEIKDSKGNTWVVHVEGFTDDCQSDEAYCEDPDAVIDEVWRDHEQRQGKKAYEQLIAGDGEYPIVVSIFRK